MNKKEKIFVAGHTGMVGRSIVRRLQKEGFRNLLVRSRAELDLTRQSEVEDFFDREKPDYVFLAAAKVGGILANSQYPAEFIYQNMMIGGNVIHASYRHGVKRLINLGSSCIYPKHAPQPMKEDYLLTGELEQTNEAYALAKISTIYLCKQYNNQYGTDFISLQPTNLFGFYDNFDLDTSHVLPAMILKFHKAKQSGTTVSLWGDGTVFREFLHADDLADAVLLVAKTDILPYDLFNVGTGKECTIRDLAEVTASVVGYTGEIAWQREMPNGTPRKLLDISRLTSIGWKPKISLRLGIEAVYAWFLKHGIGNRVL